MIKRVFSLIVLTVVTLVAMAERNTSTVSVMFINNYDYSVMKEFKEERVEGEGDSVLYYPRAIMYNKQCYALPEATNLKDLNYGRNFYYGKGSVSLRMDASDYYTYYAEVEDLAKSVDFKDEQHNVRCASGGAWYKLQNEAYVYTPVMDKGKYMVEVWAYNPTDTVKFLSVQLRNADGELIDSERRLSWEPGKYRGETITSFIDVPENCSVAICEYTETLPLDKFPVSDSEDPEAGIIAESAIVRPVADSQLWIDYVMLARCADVLEPVTTDENGYAQHISVNPITFSKPKGVVAYIATKETEYDVMLTPVTEVPAHTPFIMKGEPNTRYLLYTGSCRSLPQGKKNLLKGSTTEVLDVDGADTPVYQFDSTTGQFYVVSDADAVMEKNSVYIFSGFSEPRVAKNAKFAKVTTGVASVEEGALQLDDAVLYDMMGRSVDKEYIGVAIDKYGNKYVR